MKMKMENAQLIVADVDSSRYAIIKSWNLMRWNKGMQWLEGPATMELLDRMAKLVRLPEQIESERLRMKRIQDAVDKERMKEKPTNVYYYPVKANLFMHQQKAANMAALTFGWISPEEWAIKGGLENLEWNRPSEVMYHKGFGLLFEMGCGKTLTAISVMGMGYQMKKIRRVLVVAPTSVCPVWPHDISDYADFKCRVGVLLGTKEKRLRELDAVSSHPLEALKVCVINYESVWRDDIFDKIVEYDPDMIIADESQRIKTHDAQQSKAMHKLGDLARYKLILSGTPVQNNAIDIYSQYRFLDPTVFGTNYYAFRSRYAIMGGFNQRQIIGYRDMDKLIRKEYSIAYRVTKAEALDLPEQTFITKNIPLEGKAKQLYDKIKRDSFAELESGGQISAPTVLTKLLRLQQFTGGFIQPDEGKTEFVFDGKLKALEDIIDDYVIGEDKKLVIFCRFRPEIDLITKLIKKKKLGFISIYGDIKIEDRGAIVEDFQKNADTRIALLQIDTAGLGITLTAADTCVYYSVNFNYAAYSQSLARIHRIGQKNTCTYIQLVVEKTIDERVYKALAKKEDLATTVVDDWKRIFT